MNLYMEEVNIGFTTVIDQEDSKSDSEVDCCCLQGHQVELNFDREFPFLLEIA